MGGNGEEGERDPFRRLTNGHADCPARTNHGNIVPRHERYGGRHRHVVVIIGVVVGERSGVVYPRGGG